MIVVRSLRPLRQGTSSLQIGPSAWISQRLGEAPGSDKRVDRLRLGFIVGLSERSSQPVQAFGFVAGQRPEMRESVRKRQEKSAITLRDFQPTQRRPKIRVLGFQTQDF